MARLTAAARKALPKSAFAVPSKAPGPGSYPMPDAGHAVAAKGMAAKFAPPSVKAKVDVKANKKLAPKDNPKDSKKKEASERKRGIKT